MSSVDDSAATPDAIVSALLDLHGYSQDPALRAGVTLQWSRLMPIAALLRDVSPPHDVEVALAPVLDIPNPVRGVAS